MFDQAYQDLEDRVKNAFLMQPKVEGIILFAAALIWSFLVTQDTGKFNEKGSWTLNQLAGLCEGEMRTRCRNGVDRL